MYFHPVEGSKSIKNWLEDERPREKMLQKGTAALTDAELLAILISSGTKKKSALDLAREVLALANNDLHEVGRLGLDELQQIHGIGAARAITIAAALELGRRRQISDMPDRVTIKTCVQAAKLLIPRLQDLNQEVFYVLYLNNSYKLVKEEQMSSGGFTHTTVDIRMILKGCLLYNANKVIVAHNHPSGSKEPSGADIKITQKLKEAATVMEIELIDHLIIAGNEYLSMKNEGLM